MSVAGVCSPLFICDVSCFGLAPHNTWQQRRLSCVMSAEKAPPERSILLLTQSEVKLICAFHKKQAMFEWAWQPSALNTHPLIRNILPVPQIRPLCVKGVHSLCRRFTVPICGGWLEVRGSFSRCGVGTSGRIIRGQDYDMAPCKDLKKYVWDNYSAGVMKSHNGITVTGLWKY